MLRHASWRLGQSLLEQQSPLLLAAAHHQGPSWWPQQWCQGCAPQPEQPQPGTGHGLAPFAAASACSQLAPSRGMCSSRSPAALLAASFNQPPKSLHYERPSQVPLGMDKTMWGRMALSVLMFNDTKNQLIISGQLLYDDIKDQVDDGALQQAFGLDPKIFYSTFTLLAMHVWLVIHRLGHDTDSSTRFFVQRFYNQFQHDVEQRIYAAGVQVGVSKWTKKLETVFYSSSLAFDRVVLKQSNDTFEDIILREFFGADGTKRMQARLLAQYLRYELECLKLTDAKDILKGHIQFSRAPFARYRRSAVAD